MKLSLSTRVAESFSNKREATVALEDLAEIAGREGYYALCMRASQVGVDDSRDKVRTAAATLAAHNLSVSMVTGDFAIPENSAEGPAALRNIETYLELADDLDCDLVRICMKTADDIEWARTAADIAQERGMRIAHQSRTQSLFETVDETLEVLHSVGRSNFGLIYAPADLELCGQPYVGDTLAALYPWIFNVYLQNQRLSVNGADSVRTWCRGAVRFDPCPLWEEGSLDVPRILDELDRQGYTGYITVHQASAGLGGAEEAARRSARALRDIGQFEDRRAPL
ncbi:MAG: TIM barrel protein [bacterium]|nr:TIM barrel protein [bacterium]